MRVFTASVVMLFALAGWAVWIVALGPGLLGVELSIGQRLGLAAAALVCFVPWGVLLGAAAQAQPDLLARIRVSRFLRKVINALGTVALIIANAVWEDPQSVSPEGVERLFLIALAIYALGAATMFWDLRIALRSFGASLEQS